MDYFTSLCILFILFVLTCIVVIFIADSDILTYIAEHYGKSPASVYQGKIVWVTGASSGIGEALAKEFAKCNAKIAISARREDELVRVKNACLALNPKLTDKDILIVPLDLVSLSTHEPAFDRIIKHFGKLDVLVSNAGRSQRANWENVDLQVDKELFELNVFSVVHMNRIVLRYFLKSGHKGQLVVTSSVAGKMGMPLLGTYAASKHAIQGYFDGLRTELYGKNIDVNVLVVGPVSTGLLNAAFTEKPGETINKSYSPKERRMTPERCAFLATVAMANGLGESWISVLPVLPMLYLTSYQPFLASIVKKIALTRFPQSVGLNKGE